jgi:hypothetical protein
VQSPTWSWCKCLYWLDEDRVRAASYPIGDLQGTSKDPPQCPTTELTCLFSDRGAPYKLLSPYPSPDRARDPALERFTRACQSSPESEITTQLGHSGVGRIFGTLHISGSTGDYRYARGSIGSAHTLRQVNICIITCRAYGILQS